MSCETNPPQKSCLRYATLSSAWRRQGFRLTCLALAQQGEKPEDGCYVYGMHIEGATWNSETHKLADARPKELYSPMPCFLFLPKQHRVQPEQGMYECPLYKVPSLPAPSPLRFRES